MNIIVSLVVVYGIGFLIWMFMKKGKDKKKGEYLEKYPNAVKIYLEQKGFVVDSRINVISVNNEEPALFTHLKEYGFYCKPGTNLLVLEFSSTRPGVLHRSVTKSTGGVEIEVDIKEGTDYIISFDTEEKKFKINVK